MKQSLVFYGPVDCYAGYGARSRDIVKVLIKSNKYDVRIMSCRWGSTPSGFLNQNNSEHKQILDRILPNNQLQYQPDIFIMNTVPNEFQAVGKFNIGITAGIETTLCSAKWLEGINKMDLVLVSSEHAKKVFEDTKFRKHNGQTQQIEDSFGLTTPLKVLFEGADTNIYKKIENTNKSKVWSSINNVINENFAFLYVGHWLQGDLGADRKDVGMLVKTFLETFKDKKRRPALILKTQRSTPSILSRDEILAKIRHIETSVKGDLPSIYLLHGELTDEEMNELYNHPKVKAHISFTKGEGYGRPLLEASISAKPVIAPNYSGQTDFLNNEMSVLLPGQLTQIHHSAVVQDMLIPESSWFTVDYKKASETLKDVYTNYKKYMDGAKRQAYRSKTEFSLDKMGESLLSILEEKVPKQVKLVLPSLKKIQFPKRDNV
ncbi:MAG: glycosyltransferase, partial [Bacteroidetes bacterium]|nr:glycosyltransferase [Bacteroidota bacterium]